MLTLCKVKIMTSVMGRLYINRKEEGKRLRVIKDAMEQEHVVITCHNER